MNIIVNVDKNWAIGCKGQLLFPISQDLKRFKALTIGKVVIMGRKTLESLPGGKPLKGRKNIVLSSALSVTEEESKETGLYTCKSIKALLELLKTEDFAGFSAEDFFVIGGENIYSQLLPYCQKALVTKVEAAAENADAFFPNLETLPNWQIEARSETFYQDELAYSFVDYKCV